MIDGFVFMVMASCPFQNSIFGKHHMPLFEPFGKLPFNDVSQWLLFSREISSVLGEHCSRNSLMENNSVPFLLWLFPSVSQGLTTSRLSWELILSGRKEHSEANDTFDDLCAGTTVFDSPFSGILGNFKDVLEWVLEYRGYERLLTSDKRLVRDTAAREWFGRVIDAWGWLTRVAFTCTCLGRGECRLRIVDDVRISFLARWFDRGCPLGKICLYGVFDML